MKFEDDGYADQSKSIRITSLESEEDLAAVECELLVQQIIAAQWKLYLAERS